MTYMLLRWLGRLTWLGYVAVLGTAAAIAGVICGLGWWAAGGADPLIVGVVVALVFLAGFVFGRGEIQVITRD